MQWHATPLSRAQSAPDSHAATDAWQHSGPCWCICRIICKWQQSEMIHFCLEPTQEDVLTDVPLIRSDRNKQLVVPSYVDQLIRNITKFDNSQLKQYSRAKDILEQIETKQTLSLADFTFIEPDFTDRVLKKNGLLCDKLHQLVISYSTLERMFEFGKNTFNVRQHKHILYNMLHLSSILYVFHDRRKTIGADIIDNLRAVPYEIAHFLLAKNGGLAYTL